MSDMQFGRTYKLVAGENTAGGAGFEIGNGTSPNKTALKIKFSIEKASTTAANTGTIQIWNLSPSNLGILEKKDVSVYLSAGYNGNNALILAGTVSSVITEKDGADTMTEIEVVDGLLSLKNTHVSLSYEGKIDCKTLFDNIAALMGVSVRYGEQAEFLEYQNGFSFIGNASAALDRIAQKCNLAWSIQNGVLQVRSPSESISTQGYVLSASTGLVSIPKRSYITNTNSSSASSSNATKTLGYEIAYLMNGSIGVNDLVKIETKAVNGYFRIYKLKIDGDNMQGDWICTATVVEVK